MNITDTKKGLKERISLGLNYGLKAIEEIINEDSLLKNDFINYKSQYNDLKNIMTQNLLGYEQIEIGFNKIRLGLLSLIDQLQEKDIIQKDTLPKLRNAEIQHRKNNFFKLLEIHLANLEQIIVKLETSYNNQTTVELKEGRYAIRYIYKEYFCYNFFDNGRGNKENQTIKTFAFNYFLMDTRFEVYMKIVRMILEYVMEEEMERDFYINLFESVLSTQEMQMIFYYAISDTDESLNKLLKETKLFKKGFENKLIKKEHYLIFQ